MEEDKQRSSISNEDILMPLHRKDDHSYCNVELLSIIEKYYYK